DAAGIGFEEPHDVVQRDRFAHAAAAQDEDGLSRQNVEAYVIQHLVRSKGFGDVFECDIWLGPHFHSSLCFASSNSSRVLRLSNIRREKPALNISSSSTGRTET